MNDRRSLTEGRFDNSITTFSLPRPARSALYFGLRVLGRPNVDYQGGP